MPIGASGDPRPQTVQDIKKHKFPNSTRDKMLQLAFKSPGYKLTTCQAQLHTLARSVTVDVVEDPLEDIVVGDYFFSSDDENELSDLTQDQSHTVVESSVLTRQRSGVGSISTQTGESRTSETIAVSTESGQKYRSRIPVPSWRQPRERKALGSQKGKEREPETKDVVQRKTFDHLPKAAQRCLEGDLGRWPRLHSQPEVKDERGRMRRIFDAVVMRE